MVAFFRELPYFKYLLDITHKVIVMQTADKEKLRKMIWGVLEDNDLLRTSKSCFGRIPDFEGAYKAALRLRNTLEWENSETVFSSPDSSLKDLRENVLLDSKVLVMATPKLKNGYILLDPVKVSGNEKKASTIEGAFKLGEMIINFPRIDLVVEGSLGVDLDGNRLGKGRGFADQEIAFLSREGIIGGKTPLCSLVHPLQIVKHVPTEEHDERINMVVTPEMVIRMDKITLKEF
ncbi:MAG: 5-formyltetrahydrofolate cyclo-ligase [Methanobacterium sp.]|nr:5-formyltetrahydrofolate cyclo-ligase [Methanobacterium sp.]